MKSPAEQKIKDWIVIVSPNVSLSDNFKKHISNYIFNNGVLYFYKNIANFAEFNPLISQKKSLFLFDDMEMILFNAKVSSLKNINSECNLVNLWDKDKQVDLFKFFNLPTKEDKLIEKKEHIK